MDTDTFFVILVWGSLFTLIALIFKSKKWQKGGVSVGQANLARENAISQVTGRPNSKGHISPIWLYNHRNG